MISYLKNIFKKNTKSEPFVKVYSHPRSGTHFMEAFLAKNFYEFKDLTIAPITWGHWSNRQVKTKGNPYGKLFGNHYFADRNKNNAPKIYMLRDGRSVAYSVWKTPNFLHPDLKDLTFSEFLTTKIDWFGTPSKQVEPKQTILEHWIDHVNSWKLLEETDAQVLIINYEALVENPYLEYEKIHEKFFKDQRKLNSEELYIVNSPVGLLPNKAIKDSWKEVFTNEDLITFNNLLEANTNFNA